MRVKFPCPSFPARININQGTENDGNEFGSPWSIFFGFPGSSCFPIKSTAKTGLMIYATEVDES